MTTKREPPISIRINREILAKVKAAAELEGKTLSAFIKDAAVAAADFRIQEAAGAIDSGSKEGIPEGSGGRGFLDLVFGRGRTG